ncbi:hypothetical protein ACLF3G_07080 [Falsiroseomonas sp. HC035]|uniref:hypothetical protein n=1 Tax=Falsiroseomonas sp. HC035 TaxID=3390999 RepID=UPI003D3230E0
MDLLRQEGEPKDREPSVMPARLDFASFAFRARTPVRDFLRSLRRWLSYRPEQRYMGGRASRR